VKDNFGHLLKKRSPARLRKRLGAAIFSRSILDLTTYTTAGPTVGGSFFPLPHAF
jgi:hypothetical protein